MLVVGTLVAGRPWVWPWVAGLTPALLAGGAALIGFASTRAVLASDAGGNPTPAWSVKVHLCLYAAAATAVPAAVPLTLGAALGDRPLEWVGVPAGLVGGAGLLAVATRAAVARVRDQGPELLAAMWAR